jgi:hypothetical protein
MPERGNLPSKLTVDFSDVGERRQGGKAAHVPEGDYLLRLETAEVKKNKNDDGRHVMWVFSIKKPTQFANAGQVYERTSLKKEALFKLRNLLEDMGIPVPQKSVDIPLAKIVAAHKLVGATLADGEPYGEKAVIKSEIQATFKASEFKELAVDVGAGATGGSAGDDTEDLDEDETTETDTAEDEDLEELNVDDL